MDFTGPEICALEAHEAVALLRRGEVSPGEMLDAALARIAAVEPAINAIPILCPERARDAAARADRSPGPGRLNGLPIGIKDLVPVAGVRCTFGTPGFADFVPETSDPMVEKLESRGAVIVGKTNTPEMGAGGNTFNAVLGQTRNPWNTALNAGGSSGGAGASLASGEVWLSSGSDLMGSGRTPAAYCGVVGMRPSAGRAGGGPATHAFSIEGVQGPMARSVRDLGLFLDAMTGFDPRQPLSLEAPATPFETAAARPLERPRIAWSPDLNGFAPVEAAIAGPLAAAMARAGAAGARVEETCPPLPDLRRTYMTLRALFYATGPGRLPAEVQARFKPTLKANIAQSRDLTVDAIVDARIGRTVIFAAMQRLLEDFDLFAFPVMGAPPGPAEQEYPAQVAGRPIADYAEWLSFSFLAMVTGLPAISLPAGFTDDGMPVGLQLIGAPRGEAKLLSAAAWLEANLGVRRGPIDPRAKG